MGAANFMNHKNGIYYVTNQYIDDETGKTCYDEFFYDDFISQLEDEIDYYGKKYNIQAVKINDYSYYITRGDYKVIGLLNLEPGYYEGLQLIFITDKEEIKEVIYETNYIYDKNHKQFYKVLSKIANQVQVYARFSNGETWYNRV